MNRKDKDKKTAEAYAKESEGLGLKNVTVFYGGGKTAVYVFSYGAEQHDLVMRLWQNAQKIRCSAGDIARWCEGHGIEYCAQRRGWLPRKKVKPQV